MGMRYANVANAANSKCSVTFVSVTFVLAPPTPIYAASDWLERGLLCCGGQPAPPPRCFCDIYGPFCLHRPDFFTVLSAGRKLAQMLTTR